MNNRVGSQERGESMCKGPHETRERGTAAGKEPVQRQCNRY